MVLLKDRGHRSGLFQHRIHYEGSIIDSVSWHRQSVTTAWLVWVVSCCGPFSAHLWELFTLDAGQTTKSGPLYDLGYIPFDLKPPSKEHTWQWDLTGSTALGTMAVCENGWLKCSSAPHLTITKASQPDLMNVYFHILKKRSTKKHGLCLAPCHSLLVLSTVGFVPLFAVHLATLASFTCTNVCRIVCCVHLRSLVKLVPSVGVSRRQFASSATSCCSWTWTRPWSWTRKLLHLFKVVSITRLQLQSKPQSSQPNQNWSTKNERFVGQVMSHTVAAQFPIISLKKSKLLVCKKNK